MGYDLIPVKKGKEFSAGLFSWPIMLQQTGAGYVIGYGEGRTPGSYVYHPRNSGASPVSNDGFKVTAKEAKIMALLVRGYISVNRFINKEWEAIPEAEREQMKNVKYDGKPLYKTGVHEDQLKKLEAFCDFAEQSGGFKIY